MVKNTLLLLFLPFAPSVWKRLTRWIDWTWVKPHCLCSEAVGGFRERPERGYQDTGRGCRGVLWSKDLGAVWKSVKFQGWNQIFWNHIYTHEWVICDERKMLNLCPLKPCWHLRCSVFGKLSTMEGRPDSVEFMNLPFLMRILKVLFLYLSLTCSNPQLWAPHVQIARQPRENDWATERWLTLIPNVTTPTVTPKIHRSHLTSPTCLSPSFLPDGQQTSSILPKPAKDFHFIILLLLIMMTFH